MRAPRFPLQLPLRYRPLGDGDWRQATTENVSASGVLVRVPAPLEVDSRVEFRLALPSKSPLPSTGEVSGRGHVVRIVTPREPDVAAFALAIDEYDFLSPSNLARPN